MQYLNASNGPVWMHRGTSCISAEKKKRAMNELLNSHGFFAVEEGTFNK